MKSHYLLALILGLGLGTSAFSEGVDEKPVKEIKPKMTAEERFAKLDKNGDGVLTFEEWSNKPVKADKVKKDRKDKQDDKEMDEVGDE